MDAGGLTWDQDQDLLPPPPPPGEEGTNFPVLIIMHCPINVYWNLNIKKFVPPKGAPEPGGGAHAMA